MSKSPAPVGQLADDIRQALLEIEELWEALPPEDPRRAGYADAMRIVSRRTNVHIPFG